MLLVAAVYILSLGIMRDLDLYIHPRYVVFTLVMSAICATLAVHHFVMSTKHPHGNHNDSNNYASKLTVLLLLVAIILPATSLSSATVSQRTVANIGSASQKDQQAVSSLFSGSSRALSLNDWARLLESNNDEAYYTNKTAKISGFVYDAGLGADTVWLARFVVSCCAVDAQPVGVPVHINKWKDTYQQDQWLEVEGTFRQLQTDQGDVLVLEPTSLQSIDEPEDPYAN